LLIVNKLAIVNATKAYRGRGSHSLGAVIFSYRKVLVDFDGVSNH
jgi:hypothetical protein